MHDAVGPVTIWPGATSREWKAGGGLLISFDTYTVAPGAAGPQSVVVPYQELRAVAAPDGPLAAFMP